MAKKIEQAAVAPREAHQIKGEFERVKAEIGDARVKQHLLETFIDDRLARVQQLEGEFRSRTELDEAEAAKAGK